MFVCTTLRYVQRCYVLVGGIVADMELGAGRIYYKSGICSDWGNKQRACIVRRCSASGARGFSDMRAADAPALRR